MVACLSGRTRAAGTRTCLCSLRHWMSGYHSDTGENGNIGPLLHECRRHCRTEILRSLMHPYLARRLAHETRKALTTFRAAVDVFEGQPRSGVSKSGVWKCATEGCQTCVLSSGKANHN